MLKALAKDERQLARAADRLKALACPFRLSVMCALAAGEHSVQELCVRLEAAQPKVSQHLAVLYGKGLLASRKEANRVFYRLADADLLRLMGAIKTTFCD